jgi:DNA polymerase/3'-5' exonuclease PolX
VSRYDRRRSVVELEPVAAKVESAWREVAQAAWLCGSYRRYEHGDRTAALVGDLDVLVVGEDDFADSDSMFGTNVPEMGLTVTGKKTHGWLEYGAGDRVYVDAWLCPVESIGPFGLFLTGPMEFNVRMRQVTNRAGLMLSQYGLFEPVPKPTRMHPERRQVGERLDMPTTDPTLWEVEPLSGRSPSRLLTLNDHEEALWWQWCERVGLPEEPFPGPHERSRWSPK